MNITMIELEHTGESYDFDSRDFTQIGDTILPI